MPGSGFLKGGAMHSLYWHTGQGLVLCPAGIFLPSGTLDLDFDHGTHIGNEKQAYEECPLITKLLFPTSQLACLLFIVLGTLL